MLCYVAIWSIFKISLFMIFGQRLQQNTWYAPPAGQTLNMHARLYRLEGFIPFRFRSVDFERQRNLSKPPKQHSEYEMLIVGESNFSKLITSQFPANKFVFAFPLDWNKWCHSRTFFNNSKIPRCVNLYGAPWCSCHSHLHTKSTQRKCSEFKCI